MLKAILIALCLSHSLFAFDWALKGQCLPEDLFETGLFSDVKNLEIDKRLYPFEPQYPLWTDGASKKRYAYVPPKKKINTANMNSWKFPVGTIFFKEFSFRGKRVETRVIALGPKGWIYGSYLWNETETEATLIGKDGKQEVAGIGQFIQGKEVKHDVPSKLQCKACHDLEKNMVLGFDALQLSDDRDPNAINWGNSMPKFRGLRVSTLARNDLITHLPASPETIHASSDLERSALGYMHGNCGGCHNPGGAAQHTKLFLRHNMQSPVEPGKQTTVNQRTVHYFMPGVKKEHSYRVIAGNPAMSAVWFRLSNRLKDHQMPKIGSKIVDRAGSDLIMRWIFSLPIY